MKTALYACMSSEKRDANLSICAQPRALREYASRHGHMVVREYVDEAESARTIDRLGFEQMVVVARQKRHAAEGILACKLSRFSHVGKSTRSAHLLKNGVEGKGSPNVVAALRKRENTTCQIQ